MDLCTMSTPLTESGFKLRFGQKAPKFRPCRLRKSKVTMIFEI